MLSVEARKNRWGLLMDGVYVRLSDDSETPGPFFNIVDTTVENATLDLALAYRLVKKRRGWLDVIVGGRYVNVSTDLGLTPDYEAVGEISSAVVGGIVAAALDTVEAGVKNEAEDVSEYLASFVSGAGDAARDELRDKVQSGVEETVEDILDRIGSKVPSGKGTDIALGGGRGTVGDMIRDKISGGIQDRLDDLGDALRDAVAEEAKKRIEARFDEIKGNAEEIKKEIHRAAEEAIVDLKNRASKKVKNAIEEAEKKLATVIEDGMIKAADADLEASREWVDPYVGLRGRLNLTERTYIGGRADIGGLGVGSDLMLHLFGGVGYHLNRHVELEAGWRYLSVDYDKDNFRYDIEYSGFVCGMRVIF